MPFLFSLIASAVHSYQEYKPMQTRKKPYILNLSVLAALAVIYLHMNRVFWIYSPEPWWVSANLIECLSYFAVPVFFMISGVTLMEYRSRYVTREFFQHRLRKTVIPFLCWSILVVIYLMLTSEIQHPTIPEIITNLINTRYNDYFWFFIPLFSVYLSIPVLTAIPDESRESVFGYGVAAAFLINSLLPFAAQLCGIEWNFALTIQTVSSFMLFVLIGWWLNRHPLTQTQRTWIYVLGIAGFCVHFFGTWVMSARLGTVDSYFKGYFTPFSVLYSSAVFTFFRYMKPARAQWLAGKLSWFAPATLGIYMIHWFVLRLIFGLELFDEQSLWFRVLGPMVVFAVCTVIVRGIQRIPGIRKIVPR